MKCKICGGTGTSNTCVNGTFKPCIFCDGTGEYEPFDADIELDKLDSEPHTNEEWFCSLPTEEKADKLTDFSFWLVPNLPTEDKREQIRKRIVEWLKKPHSEVAE